MEIDGYTEVTCKMGDFWGLENVVLRTWMLASAKRKRKKMEERGAGKRMLTDCKAISDPPPTHRASIRLDIPLCRTHVLINTQTML